MPWYASTMALGEAFINVNANLKPFKSALDKDIERILKTAQDKAKTLGERFGKTYGDGVSEGIRARTRKIGDRVAKTFAKIKPPKISFTVDERAEGTFNRVLSRLRNGTTSTAELIGFRLNQIASVFKETVANLAGIPARSPLASLLAAVIIPTVVAASGAIVDLGQSLVDLGGFLSVLPSGFAAVIGLVVPLKLAFLGVGDAITDALQAKDAKELKEALKGLSPEARTFAREVVALKKPFTDLKTVAQDAFFGAIVGALTPTVERLLPILTSGFREVATFAGNFARSLIEFAGSPAVINLLTNLFPTIETIVSTLEPAVIRVLTAIAVLATENLPFLESLAAGFAELLNKFATFIEESIASGEFQQWLDDAVKTAGELKDLALAIGELLKAIFIDADTEGQSFLVTLTNIIEKMAGWFASKDGQQFLKNLIRLAQLWATTLQTSLFIIGAIIEALNKVQNSPALAVLSPLAKLAGFADGGIVDRPTVAMVGEGGGPEAIIPLNNPKRAAQVAQEAGLDDMLGGGTVNVFIGNEMLDARMFKVVRAANRETARSLTFQPRTV